MAHRRIASLFRFPDISRQPTAFSLSSGVTLIELLMVMVVMAIVMAISIPAFNSMGRGADMRGAVGGVRATLAQSRQWAITHREQVTFRWVPKASVTSPACYFVINATGQLLQAVSTLPLSVDFNILAGVDAVTFKTDGSLANGVDTRRISLVSSNVPGKEIEITGLTGGIQVQ